MKNKLGNLGFLSFLGFLGLITGNMGFYGFFGFMAFFAAYEADEERVEYNMGRATKAAFAYVVSASAIWLTAISLTEDPMLALPAFLSLFIGAILVCVGTFTYYDKTGN